VKSGQMSEVDLERLRRSDAERTLAESGYSPYGEEEAIAKIVGYYELVAEIHETYDLDEDETYVFDLARGAIFQERD
jgi:hypothetical protein